MPDKVIMSPTWVGLVRYWWTWSRMTKHTWLTKPQNFERVSSNLLSRLICNSFGSGRVVKTHSKEVKVWLVYKWTIDSRNAWFSCSRFLKIKISSMDVDMIINTVKYDTNKRWVIHNLNQQEVDDAWFFEKNSFEDKG